MSHHDGDWDESLGTLLLWLVESEMGVYVVIVLISAAVALLLYHFYG